MTHIAIAVGVAEATGKGVGVGAGAGAGAVAEVEAEAVADADADAETRLGNAYGDCENHINGDIVFAVRQYWLMTGDADWLEQTAWPLVSGIANFWASKAKPQPKAKAKARLNASGSGSGSGIEYVIHNVMPPDEYHQRVNNSAYTNTVASIALLFAADVAAILQRTERTEGLVDQQSKDNTNNKNNKNNNATFWREVGSQMFVPYDAAVDYHPEYDGYAQGTTIKQGDVILMGFPLEAKMAPATRANDLQQYAAVTSNGGPAMTWAMFAVGYLDTGKLDLAYSNFKRGYANVRPPFNVWTETPTGGAVNFLTGAGGFLQSVIFGYAGLRIRGTPALGLVLDPPPPPGATEAGAATGFNLHGVDYLSNALRIEVTADEMTVMLLSASATAKSLILVDGNTGKTIAELGGRSVVKVKRTLTYIRAKGQ